jgi:hypothetical protein
MDFRGTTFLEFADRFQQTASSPAVGFHCTDGTSVTDGYAPLKKLFGGAGSGFGAALAQSAEYRGVSGKAASVTSRAPSCTDALAGKAYRDSA